MMMMMMPKSVPEVVAAPSSTEIQDVIVEDGEFEDTIALEDDMVGEETGEENVSLQVEGQSA